VILVILSAWAWYSLAHLNKLGLIASRILIVGIALEFIIFWHYYNQANYKLKHKNLIQHSLNQMDYFRNNKIQINNLGHQR
jgi:hypothetical protein